MTAPILYLELDHILVGDEAVGPHQTTGDVIYVETTIPYWEDIKVDEKTFILREATRVENTVFQKNYVVPIIIEDPEIIGISLRGIV